MVLLLFFFFSGVGVAGGEIPKKIYGWAGVEVKNVERSV